MARIIDGDCIENFLVIRRHLVFATRHKICIGNYPIFLPTSPYSLEFVLIKAMIHLLVSVQECEFWVFSVILGILQFSTV